LKRLWAPWRITYILSPKPDKCIFCEYSKKGKDEDNYILYRGKNVFIMMNIYPYNTGHVMIVPYRHVPTIEDLSFEETSEMMEALKLVIKAIRKSLNPSGFNVGFNIGRIAGAGIEDHIHMHVVPRWPGDTNFMPVIGDTKVISELLRDTYIKIKKAIDEVKGEGHG